MLIRNCHLSNLLQTCSLDLYASFIRIRQHDIMRGILEQDDFRLLIVDLGKRKLKKRYVLKKKFAASLDGTRLRNLEGEIKRRVLKKSHSKC